MSYNYSTNEVKCYIYHESDSVMFHSKGNNNDVKCFILTLMMFNKEIVQMNILSLMKIL